MLIVAEPENVPLLEEIARRYHLAGAVVGEVTDTGRLVVNHGDEVVADLPVSLIVENSPEYDREANEPLYISQLSKEADVDLPEVDIKDALMKLFSSPNICSKKWVYSQYDYQVGTNTVLVPGADAAVLRLKWPEKPEISTSSGIALSCEGNGRMVYLEPFEGHAGTLPVPEQDPLR